MKSKNKLVSTSKFLSLVHLSPDEETATKVGSRRGQPIVLCVAAETMHRDGHQFYLSANGVWLVDAVPAAYLTFPG
ncbi:RNA 2'-phosphotransferase [Roseimaritima ulvae]|uniref:RNA 2'-phosphotransferase n=1 Tax=Roseimaritima ulvae TaxID=980254 RepID=A0A5B9QNW4_9BACT|nr:RNA 2'-phosphotransferase [Roseimaritima ulvae]QEG39350.1 RNA 2'-phosphotransferase [Roseimaritima ulvae]